MTIISLFSGAGGLDLGLIQPRYLLLVDYQYYTL